VGVSEGKEGAGKAAGVISATAGTPLSVVIQFALKNNFVGIEKMMGIPGTIGGAVRGNAGAFGCEIKDVFKKALILDDDNEIKEVGPDFLNFGYRESAIKKSKKIILKVWMEFKKDPESAKKALEEGGKIIIERIGKQPKGKCCGSFFKNPDQQLSAGYLLEQCGCKGLQVGGAQVSHEHANWIINRGDATQEDVINLSSMMKERVLEHFDVTLEREVQLVGEFGMIED
jgi:UDP-N-acetylmuramate dehydrogenase